MKRLRAALVAAMLILSGSPPIDFSRVEHGVAPVTFMRQAGGNALASGADLERALFGPPSFEL